MKKILGLDLGVASIGWAFILEDDKAPENNQIVNMGVRIVQLDTKLEKDEFAKGGSVGTNAKRRMFRGQRRNLQRYKLRRKYLRSVLSDLGLTPDESLHRLSAFQHYNLRKRALEEQLTLQELGRVLLHLNVRRGFKSNRKGDEKSESEYKEAIKAREQRLSQEHSTIGQFFAKQLKENAHFRIRQEVFNRSSYQDEFDQIWNFQAAFYPNLLTDANRKKIRDKGIYYQRALRSQKGLVGECALEWNYAVDGKTKEWVVQANGQYKVVRPKSAPKSSPLSQIVRIWENIHNVRIENEKGERFPLNDAQKKQVFDVLQEKKELSEKELLKLIGLNSSLYSADELIKEKKLQGNSTRIKLLEILKKHDYQDRSVLEFQPGIHTVLTTNPESGEKFECLQLDPKFIDQPLYALWHLIYATEEESNLIKLLMLRFGFSLNLASDLAKLNFTAEGYTSKSSRAMRRLLPHLQSGSDYTDACKKAGYNHSNSITKSENERRLLLDKLESLPKNSLRNPVVEKILNQMINVVNAILADPNMGRPDEIRVELARELKQSAKERKKTFSNNNLRERQRNEIRKKIAEMLGMQENAVTKVQIEKWQLWHEVDGFSPYSGNRTELSDFLLGRGVDVEHIIPRSRCFDDSFENKTICETRFNQEKDKQTALDFMESRPIEGLQPVEAYFRMITDLAKKGRSGGIDGPGISRGKLDRLMMRADKIPTDFINRQLRETQYIAKKATELLKDISRNVFSTSGSVTDFLRHQWGWDEVIEQDRIEQFRNAGLTEVIKIKNGTQDKEVIPGWNKRKDHRHHALDALTVACTKQSVIQKLNSLNQTLEQYKGEDRRDAIRVHGAKQVVKASIPFNTAKVAKAISAVLISFKQGAQVATFSKNKRGNQINLIPRGPLHEETIYGRIKKYKTVELNSRFDMAWIDQMVHPHQRELLEARLARHGNNPKLAFKNLEKEPIFYGPNNRKVLKQVTLWDYLYVSRKSVGTELTAKQVEKVIDPTIRKALLHRLEANDNKPKEAFKNLDTQPLVGAGGAPVKKVRVLNPAEKMVVLPRGYAEHSGNHHIAVYRDELGKLQEHVVTFWDAFWRVKSGLPAIITDVSNAYDSIEKAENAQIPDDLHLPELGWTFVTSLQINDYFLFGIDPEALDPFNPKSRTEVSKALFRVRKLSSGNYWFMHHLETEILEDTESKKAGRCKQASISSLQGAIKVKLDRLGNIRPI